jgi:hypothetical protein
MKLSGVMRVRLLVCAYTIISLCLFLYSYTQVDLGLTLTRASLLQTVQQLFQSIGYFHRQASTGMYVSIILVLTALYEIVLSCIRRKTVSSNIVWLLIGIVTVLVMFSYPAFSYDFFNYLFTAKTILVYHKNPYGVIPLQFTGVEPWLSFMHWTHLPSAYTPLWITVTLLPFLLGFKYLLFTLWSLKIVIALAYITTAIGIQKILNKIDRNNSLLGVAIFALNPLIIIECLVSGHNDILMMCLAIWAMVSYVHAKKYVSWLLLSLSVAMKLITLVLVPAFFMKWNRTIALVCMLIGFLAVITQREVLGWYWVWIVPFVALVPEARSITIISSGISLGLLLRYVPFLYLGDWNGPAMAIKTWLTWVPIVVSFAVAGSMRFAKKPPHR